MAYLLDTGILLRLVNAQDRLHSTVRLAVELIGAKNEEVFTTSQNIAEFWNVATRPIADNGLGLLVGAMVGLLEQIVEPVCGMLTEHPATYQELKHLGAKYQFRGKQIHDARIAAQMLCWKIDNILTLNDRDFHRYEPEGIKVVTPDLIVAEG